MSAALGTVTVAQVGQPRREALLLIRRKFSVVIDALAVGQQVVLRCLALRLDVDPALTANGGKGQALVPLALFVSRLDQNALSLPSVLERSPIQRVRHL